ncbi:DNA-binding response regulator [Asanoa ishikariensis]|uniref:DNA-binding response regulator, NarL/FixJ family, contains REC and HTH domains n=1 Tax=Asanoa ishikariensis TaxID=137265 RepID=A0A1H3TE16_9ACTN|nr:response regulator transcription factor [Asanoa ishikariensis]GIF62623.1 DNA-binding response regulator [Asanoa ishikariensis]SDZ48340.1 DNA-binding response regulator, NarL/FixJ family, contains REC and HTH domains [Asanoa ishikariensis]
MRVVIAEDNALMRDGIAALLTDHDVTVLAAVSDGTALLAAVAEHRPDVAIVDVRMPPTFTDEGVRAAIAIKAAHPATGVLVFSQWVETVYANALLRDHPERVGYLLKDRIVSTAAFLDALRRIADGGVALDPEVIRQLFAAPDAGLARLTAREREILALVAEGRSNPAIAAELHLAGRSVEKHVTAIFTKLDLPPSTEDHRRVRAVLRYLEAR